MKIKLFVLTALLYIGLNMAAAPARPGKMTIAQPNGHTFTAILRGDEFFHIMTTEDGCAVVMDKDGYYSYAAFNAAGERFSSGVHVGDNASGDVLADSRQIPYEIMAAKAAEKRAMAPQDNREPILKRIKDAQIGTKADETTTKHGIVILAAFSDVPFTYTKENFEAMLTQEGYNYNGATGSAKEYFDDQFSGLYEFDFDVSSIVTLSNTQEYYGGNDSDGNDLHPEYMIRDACKLADEEIDFSLYDDDGDGEVDNVFVFFAGGDEAEYAGDNCIWSHAWYLYDSAGISLTCDGKRINRYACTSELTVTAYDRNSNPTDYAMTGIGTFCHEYTHTFGVPDLYDTDYSYSGDSGRTSAGMWTFTALMDSGNYNNDGNTPPYLNAIERDYLGLGEGETLVEGEYTLEPINLNNRFLRMDTDTEGEYYLFECRSDSGWDAYVNERNGKTVKGMLVYHVDKSTSRTVSTYYYGDVTPARMWEYLNSVNVNPSHQCADLVEADGRTDSYSTTYYPDLSGLYFPAGADSFTPDGSPAFTYWSGSNSEYSITDIALDDDGNVTFSVVPADETTLPTAINIGAVTFQDAAIVSWSTSPTSSRTAYLQIGDFEAVEVEAYETGSYAYVCEGLSPNTTYVVKIWYENSETAGNVAQASFTTKSVPTTYAYPFIYFTTPANSSGTFTSGTKIPLRVYNAVDATSVTWTLGGSEIEVGGDGYYTLTSGGTLRATITYPSGATEIITRRITIGSE